MGEHNWPIERGGVGPNFRLNPQIAVASEAGIPIRLRFSDQVRVGLVESGLFVTKIAIERGMPDLNAVTGLRVVNDDLTPGLSFELPRVTEVAFDPSIQSFYKGDNFGKSLPDQQKFAEDYASELATSMDVEPKEISGVIGLGPEIQEVFGRYLEVFKKMPINEQAPFWLRTASESGGMSVVMRVSRTHAGGYVLCANRAPKHRGDRVGNDDRQVVAWPFIMPRAAVV